MFLEQLLSDIFSNRFCCAVVRLSLTVLAAYSSYYIIFYRISTQDDLLGYFERIEYPDDPFAKSFRKFQKIFMLRYSFVTGLATTALLAIQYPDESYIANAMAIFYGILGPWTVRDQIMASIRGRANLSVEKNIIDSKPDIKETADIFLQEAIENFNKEQAREED